MLRAFKAREFDPGQPVVARRAFRTSGRYFEAGSDFPWRTMSVSQRRVRQMYDAGMLVHPHDLEEQPEPQKEEPKTELVNVAQVKKLAELQDIAREEGAPIKTSKAEQRAAILAHRKESHS